MDRRQREHLQIYGSPLSGQDERIQAQRAETTCPQLHNQRSAGADWSLGLGSSLCLQPAYWEPTAVPGWACLCHTPRFLWPGIALREPPTSSGLWVPLHPPAASGGGQWPATPESTLTACDFFLPVQVEHLPPCCLFFLAKVQF